MLAMLMILQGVVGPPAPHVVRKIEPATIACPEVTTGEEIVVCGRPADQRRPRMPVPDVRAPDAPMTFRLPGGGTGNVHAIQSTLPGARGLGVALSLKIPFGKAKRPAAD